MSRENEAMGDEDWLAVEERELQEQYEADHEEDWKYN